MKTYPCGCTNDTDPITGADFSVTKCDHHKSKMRECGELGADYYQELGAIGGSELEHPHVREFEECFGKLPKDHAHHVYALEIGAGCSHYVPMLIEAGYWYFCCEPSEFARNWVRERYPDDVQMAFESVESAMAHDAWPYNLVLMAHSLEHMPNAPQVLKDLGQRMRPGDELYLVIPDDSDPLNPDHLWFFNATSLAKAVELAGLTVETMEVRRRVVHERFIYCKARKAT